MHDMAMIRKHFIHLDFTGGAHSGHREHKLRREPNGQMVAILKRCFSAGWFEEIHIALVHGRLTVPPSAVQVEDEHNDGKYRSHDNTRAQLVRSLSSLTGRHTAFTNNSTDNRHHGETKKNHEKGCKPTQPPVKNQRLPCKRGNRD